MCSYFYFQGKHITRIIVGGKRAAAPFLVYFIGMFSLGFPEILPPTIIMTMHIRSIPYIHPFAPHDYSVPYSNCDVSAEPVWPSGCRLLLLFCFSYGAFTVHFACDLSDLFPFKAS